MSQTKLGDAIGLTFQQVQKYERGSNRVGSSRLFQLSEVLNVPVSFFFDNLPEEIAGPTGRRKKPSKPFTGDPLTRPEILEFVRTYHRIPTAAARKNVFELVKALAKMTNPD